MHDVSHLKKMDRIKSEFVHTVSHDLRSPLTAILGYVELIDRVGPVNEMQRNFIKRVQASVQNITRLVDDLVSLGQIEASFDLSRETVRMDQIARFVAEEMVDEFHAMNQTLNLVIPNELPAVLADPLQMRQLVSHLLDNAHKYTPDGGTITLAMEVDTNQLILVVQDTGVGIPSLDLLYVFEKFYRGANVSTETSGTGLGLAIVKSIVESHQGRVWVESPPGGGTRVAVVLPLARQS
jgi:two-component system NtrC family sensor kinase